MAGKRRQAEYPKAPLPVQAFDIPWLAVTPRAELADALRRLVKAGIELEGASDHGVSEALYLRDPDGNGVEAYWDRSKEQWPRTPSGELNMVTERLDLDSLLNA